MPELAPGFSESQPELRYDATQSVQPIQLFYTNEITLGGTTRRLRRPLKLEVSRDESGYWEIFAPAIPLAGSGETARAALADLLETANDLYLEFSGTAGDRLHRSAISMRARLQRILGDE